VEINKYIGTQNKTTLNDNSARQALSFDVDVSSFVEICVCSFSLITNFFVTAETKHFCFENEKIGR